MTELIVYAILFLLLLGHALLAGIMYRAVHADDSLDFKSKNDWKLKALVFPLYYWRAYRKSKG